MPYHIADRYQTEPSAFQVRSGESAEGISTALHGTVFQQVTDRLLYGMDRSHFVVFQLWYRPLNRRDAATRTSWWMRRGKRFWGYWAWWQLSSAWEGANLTLLRAIYHGIAWVRPLPDGASWLSWRGGVRYLWGREHL